MATTFSYSGIRPEPPFIWQTVPSFATNSVMSFRRSRPGCRLSEKYICISNVLSFPSEHTKNVKMSYVFKINLRSLFSLSFELQRRKKFPFRVWDISTWRSCSHLFYEFIIHNYSQGKGTGLLHWGRRIRIPVPSLVIKQRSNHGV